MENEDRMRLLRNYIIEPFSQTVLIPAIMILTMLPLQILNYIKFGQLDVLIALVPLVFALVAFIPKLYERSTFKDQLDYVMQSGNTSRILSDFKTAVPWCNDKFRMGEEYIFVKGQSVTSYRSLKKIYIKGVKRGYGPLKYYLMAAPNIGNHLMLFRIGSIEQDKVTEVIKLCLSKNKFITVASDYRRYKWIESIKP